MIEFIFIFFDFNIIGDNTNDGDDTPEILLSPDGDLYVEIPSDDNGTFHDKKN